MPGYADSVHPPRERFGMNMGGKRNRNKCQIAIRECHKPRQTRQNPARKCGCGSCCANYPKGKEKSKGDVMDDWQWFVAHPDRRHRTRLATPAEIDGLGRHGMLPAAARSKWVLHGLKCACAARLGAGARLAEALR